MSEFKPMVKMETTEPSVELKLKKGGSIAHKTMAKKADNQKPVKKAMGGGLGAMPPMNMGAPSIDSPKMPPMAMAPKRPALSLRNRAMRGRPMPPRAMPPEVQMPAPPPMKKGGKADKKCSTGGIQNGNGGGYKKGGMANFEKSGKDVEKNGVKEGSKADMALDKKQMMNMKKGGMTKGGCMKTGGSTGDVKMGNGGGYKKGGALKKFANGGSAVAMPQGSKKASPPVAINMLSGTYKKGGNVKKYKDGDSVINDAEQRATTKGYNNTLKNETAENEADAKAVQRALMYIPNQLGKIGTAIYEKAKSSVKPTTNKKRGGSC